MKPRHALMAVAVVIAGWLALFADKTPGDGVAEPVVAAKGRSPNLAVGSPSATSLSAPSPVPAPVPTTGDVATEQNARHGKLKLPVTILALRARDELIGGASSKGGSLFGSQSWVPPPPPPPKPSAPPPLTAPPLPYSFIGKKLEDAVWEVYLTKDEHTFIVREKTVLEQTYRVDSIKPPTLTLTYLPLNQMQTLTIGGAD